MEYIGYILICIAIFSDYILKLLKIHDFVISKLYYRIIFYILDFAFTLVGVYLIYNEFMYIEVASFVILGVYLLESKIYKRNEKYLILDISILVFFECLIYYIYLSIK